MAITCEPESLVSAAGCLTCLTPFQAAAIEVYLLKKIAADNHTLEELMDLAKCYSCLNLKQLLEIQTYLLCQILNT